VNWCYGSGSADEVEVKQQSGVDRTGIGDRAVTGCKRLRKLGEQLSKGVGRSIPWACEDWAVTKAAYRFISNGRVREGQILASHFQATRERVKRGKEPILIVHDTTEFSYRRKDMAAVGMVSKRTIGKDSQGQSVYSTTCGICLHSSLAVKLEGLPLGLTAVKFWSRKNFKDREAKRKRKWKACVGWRICVLRPRYWDKPRVWCTLAIRRATFSICSLWRDSWGRTFWYARAVTGWPTAVLRA
jgi:hypothetical protein